MKRDRQGEAVCIVCYATANRLRGVAFVPKLVRATERFINFDNHRTRREQVQRGEIAYDDSAAAASRLTADPVKR